MDLSRTITEINGDFGRKRNNSCPITAEDRSGGGLYDPLLPKREEVKRKEEDGKLEVFPLNFITPVGLEKTGVMAMPV